VNAAEYVEFNLNFLLLCRTHEQLTLENTNARDSYRRALHLRQRNRMNYPTALNILPDFPEWLRNTVQAGMQSFEDDVVNLYMSPCLKSRSFKSIKCYGKFFRVCSAEVNMVTSNSGVTITCETMQRSGLSDTNLVSGAVTYFGKVKEILELDYGRLKPVILLCDWIAPISRGSTACLKKDNYGFTLVKLSRLMRSTSRKQAINDWDLLLQNQSQRTVMTLV